MKSSHRFYQRWVKEYGATDQEWIEADTWAKKRTCMNTWSLLKRSEAVKRMEMTESVENTRDVEAERTYPAATPPGATRLW